MELLSKIGGVFLVTIVMVFIISLLIGYPTMWLWNYVMPVIFGLTKITFWQAFALNCLAGIFFKSTGSSKD